MTVSYGDSYTNGHSNGHLNGHAQEAFVDGSVAVSPNAPELVPGLLDQVASHGKAFACTGTAARTELLDAARQLVYALETPREAMIRFCWSQVGHPSFHCMRGPISMTVPVVNTICLFGDSRGPGPLQEPFQG